MTDETDPGPVECTVQVLRPADWPLWRRLRRAALADAPAAFGATLADWSGSGDTEARWRARLIDVPFTAIIHLHGTAAGTVSAFHTENGAAELISLWVAPHARGRGVADAAIGAVVDWAVDRDIGLVVRADNHAARKLYRRCGFADIGPASSGGVRMLRPGRTRSAER